MPNLTYIRPSDVEEVIGAWQYSLANSHGSSMISLARDPTVTIPNTNRNKVSKGCYVIQENENACITLASCGSNLHYAVAAAEMLEEGGFPTRVVSA
jgi:dihydroxyacetone synthase